MTRIPIFIPPVVNGKMYSDQYYGRYDYTDIRMIKHWIEYDILQKQKGDSITCNLDEIIVPKSTDDWKEIYETRGKSTAFSQGILVDLVTGVAMANGYDQGFIPVDISFNGTTTSFPNEQFAIPHDQLWSIALSIWKSPGLKERDYFDLKAFNSASMDRDRLNSRYGLMIGLAQGIYGARLMNTRLYVITVQEHRKAPGFYRAQIETRIAYVSASLDNGPTFLGSSFLSFQNGSWREDRFLNVPLK